MLLRRIARPMLASMFISGGINALKSPQGHAQEAKPVLDAAAPAIDKAVEVAPIDHRPDDEMLIKIDGAVKVVAGTMLAFGTWPRLASTALAASLIPTTLAGHRFWECDDPVERQTQQIHFMKNVGLLGGLLIAAADTEGKPSLGWRGRRAARRATVQAEAITEAAADIGGRITGAASDVTGRVTDAVSDTTGRVADKASEVGSTLGDVRPRARRRTSGDSGRAAGTAAGLAAGLAGLAPGAAISSRASELSHRAAHVLAQAERRGAKLQHDAAKRSAKLRRRAAKRSAAWQKAAARKRAELERRAPGYVEQLTAQAARLGHDVAGRASAVGHEVARQAGGVTRDARKRMTALTH